MDKSWKIVPLKIEHAFALAPILRRKDKNELWAISNLTEEQILVCGAKSSRPGYALITSKGIAACFGVVPEGHQKGIVWLLGSNIIDDIKYSFAKQSLLYINKFLCEYKFLYNYVDARYCKSIKWLKWCGFNIAPEPWPYGIEQKPFYFFWKERGC